MAKPAVAGRVKTRLIPALGPRGAAAVHEAMLACVLERVRRLFEADGHKLLLGWAFDAVGQGRQDLQPGGWRLIDQGGGDLGQRMLHCWRQAGGGPAMFLGVDCPDLPADALLRAAAALDDADAALGPAADGGYWTLAARRCEPALLAGIDWGSARVYDQTRAAAASAGLSVRELPRWRDVDDPADLLALHDRLRHADDPDLLRLRQRLDPLIQKLT